MKDKTARALAIVALVFMAIFVGALVATLVDYKLLGGSIGFIALGCGVFALMIFVALKADGRGYSITQMNNEIEMQKLEKAAEEQKASEQNADAENKPEDMPPQSDADAVIADGATPDGQVNKNGEEERDD